MNDIHEPADQQNDDGDTVQIPKADWDKVQKRLDDKDEFITTLKQENEGFRGDITKFGEQLARLDGSVSTLAANKEPDKKEPTYVERLSEAMQEEDFRQDLDDNPHKVAQLVLQVAQETGKNSNSQMAELQSMIMGMIGEGKDVPSMEQIGELLDQKLQAYPEQYQAQQEIEVYRPFIDKLKENPAYKDLPEPTLLSIAKDAGAEPEQNRYSGHSAVGRVSRGHTTKVSQSQLDQWHQVGVKLGQGNAEYAKDFVKRMTAKHNG